MKNKLISFARGFGLAVLTFSAAYLSNPTNLTFLSAGIAAVVAGAFALVEQYIQDHYGRALLGAVHA